MEDEKNRIDPGSTKTARRSLIEEAGPFKEPEPSGYTCVRLRLNEISGNARLRSPAFKYQIVKQRYKPQLPMMEVFYSLLQRTFTTRGTFECEINWSDHAGTTVLMIACFEPNNVKMVQDLLYHGANPMAFDGLGQSALHIAAKKGRLGVMRLLVLNAGVPVNITRSRNDWTPLLSAVANRRQDSVEILAELSSATKTSLY